MKRKQTYVILFMTLFLLLILLISFKYEAEYCIEVPSFEAIKSIKLYGMPIYYVKNKTPLADFIKFPKDMNTKTNVYIIDKKVITLGKTERQSGGTGRYLTKLIAWTKSSNSIFNENEIKYLLSVLLIDGTNIFLQEYLKLEELNKFRFGK